MAAYDLRGTIDADGQTGTKNATFKSNLNLLAIFTAQGGIPVPLAASPFNPGIQT